MDKLTFCNTGTAFKEVVQQIQQTSVWTTLNTIIDFQDLLQQQLALDVNNLK